MCVCVCVCVCVCMAYAKRMHTRQRMHTGDIWARLRAYSQSMYLYTHLRRDRGGFFLFFDFFLPEAGSR